MFLHVNAPDFYVLKGLVPAAGTSSCGLISVDRDQLARLVCNAGRQLSASGRNRWEAENRELLEIHQRLVNDGRLPRTPPDPCALVPSATTVSTLASTEVTAYLLDESLPELLVDLQ
jgi:hypothetical protein